MQSLDLVEEDRVNKEVKDLNQSVIDKLMTLQ